MADKGVEGSPCRRGGEVANNAPPDARMDGGESSRAEPGMAGPRLEWLPLVACVHSAVLTSHSCPCATPARSQECAGLGFRVGVAISPRTEWCRHSAISWIRCDVWNARLTESAVIAQYLGYANDRTFLEVNETSTCVRELRRAGAEKSVRSSERGCR